MDRYIYHYTSLNTLLKIIESNSIYLSDVLKSNDPSELSDLKWQIVKSKSLTREDKVNLIENLYFKSPCSDNESRCFSLSFSSRKDILTSWREYGDYGAGVCIGFNLSKLEELFDSLSVNKIYGCVKYGDIQKDLEIDSVIRKNKNDEHSSFEATKELAKTNMLLFKHRINNCEKEYRVAIVLNPSEELKANNNVGCHLDYDEGVDKIIFRNIFSRDPKDAYATQIAVGPRVMIHELCKIKQLIKLYDYKVYIKTLDFPIQPK